MLLAIKEIEYKKKNDVIYLFLGDLNKDLRAGLRVFGVGGQDKQRREEEKTKGEQLK